MPLKTLIFTVDTHTGGEPTRIVTSYLRVPGKTMVEKKNYIQLNLDHLRRSLIQEPRGHQDMFGAFLLDPIHEEADIGIVFADSHGYLTMCGHGCIGVVTAAVELGFAKPKKEIILDTPAGLVKARPEINEDKVSRVTIQNVPSFLYKSIELDIPKLGRTPIDIAYGGNFFAIINLDEKELRVVPENLDTLIKIGIDVKRLVNSKMEIRHPSYGLSRIDLVEFSDASDKPSINRKNVVIFGKGQVDRSPCGTGTCAKMATLYTRDQLNINQTFVQESIICTTFEGRLIGETKIGEFDAVIPEVTGSAYVTGFHQFIINEEDPLKYGFQF